MAESMLIVESRSLDVYRNLAIEEYLMDQVRDHASILFLWQSDCAVVLGKNQNPWKECRLDLMRDENVPLARRLSGGGTVYHDAGNLNYCIIVDRTGYREQQAYDMVCDALQTFGIRAERTGKSNLSVDGRKFSGNAFCFRKGRAMHHGTLLLQTDLMRLGRYLGSMLDGIETHAIASVPAEVTNLNLDLNGLRSALIDRFRSSYGVGSATTWTDADIGSGLDALAGRQQSPAWRYGATPRFVLEHNGGRLEVVKGIITAAEGFEHAERLIKKHFSEIAFSFVC